ncbi:hypothetical protein [Actinomadura sp. DC4]|uniref:hypothetical protein n=1 Tax=Actinomadura sp. DC4 TaxID=3055069 RepID=UPI0025AEEE8A|nr:hypothetical protein [Actinomadura sp. DC4]MDN3354789.1 hypothetical protein [Actinomadura sp. DC4]
MRTPTPGRTVVPLFIAAVFFGGFLSDDANASISYYDGNGNGRHNRNSFIINSPSFSHDVQHIRNVNVDGNTVTPAAICRRPARRCVIIQRLVVFDR